MTAEINPQPLPPRADRIRIHVPNDVLYNLEKMNKITAAVLSKLGCGGCHSGRVFDYVGINQFVVNPKTLEVSETTGSL